MRELSVPLRAELRALARAAVLEITHAEAIGSDAGESAEEDGSISVLFDSALAGYPGWKWTVSMAALDDVPPTVLEVELIPSTGALLSPDWVPWSDRLAEYEAAQDALTAAGDVGDDDDDDSDVGDDADSDDDDDDDDSDDDDSSDVLHGGDLDGVDIDTLDDESDDDDDDDDDDGADSDDDDSDDDDDDDPDEGSDRSY
jgi:hypothetical protein